MRPTVIDRRIAFSILIGLVVTTVSGISINTNVVGELPNVQFVSQPLLGMSYWGYVLPWLKQVVYPRAVKSVIWQNYVADVFIWSVVAYIVLAAFKLPFPLRLKKKPKRKPRLRRKRR